MTITFVLYRKQKLGQLFFYFVDKSNIFSRSILHNGSAWELRGQRRLADNNDNSEFVESFHKFTKALPDATQ